MAEPTSQKDSRIEMRPENVHFGMRLGPISYTVEQEQIDAFAAALGSVNPLYQGDAALAPPTMRLLDYSLLIAKHFKGGKGGVHAKHRCEMIEPLRVGQSVQVDGVIKNVERKRGKFYFTLEYETKDANDGRVLVRQAITSVLLSPTGTIT